MKPLATKTMFLIPLTSLLSLKSRLTLTCKCSFFSYREKQVISQKHLDKCLKSSFDGKMFLKFQFIREFSILKFYMDYFTH